MKECNLELLERYLQNDLSSEQEEAVFSHLLSCQKCCDNFAVIAAIQEYEFDLNLANRKAGALDEVPGSFWAACWNSLVNKLKTRQGFKLGTLNIS